MLIEMLKHLQVKKVANGADFKIFKKYILKSIHQRIFKI